MNRFLRSLYVVFGLLFHLYYLGMGSLIILSTWDQALAADLRSASHLIVIVWHVVGVIGCGIAGTFGLIAHLATISRSAGQNAYNAFRWLSILAALLLLILPLASGSAVFTFGLDILLGPPILFVILALCVETGFYLDAMDRFARTPEAQG